MALKGQLVGIPKPKESVLRGRVNRLITGLDEMKARHVREFTNHHARILKLQEMYKQLSTIGKTPKETVMKVEVEIRRNISMLTTSLDKMAKRHERELEEQYRLCFYQTTDDTPFSAS